MLSDIEKIKNKLSIVDVVSSYIKLENIGNNYKACCPFHNEKTPSFNVSIDRGMYYCFGCSRGGDIFSFVQEIESIDFFSALKLLADKAGVSLTGAKSEKGKNIVLYDILDKATKLYEASLRKDKDIVNYLLDRGVSKESIIKFRVGYTPNSSQYLYQYLKKVGFSDENMFATGLIASGKYSPYDRFRERIMFPILDSSGRVVAHSGRIFLKDGSRTDPKKTGKYINTNDTVLFHKSKILYGYSFAKRAMMVNDNCVVVEGQFDCMLSQQSGVVETVALSGTALSSEQVKLISRFTNRVTLALDGDDAGLKAARRSIEALFALDMYVNLALLPDGMDPADVIKKSSGDWVKILADATDYISVRVKIWEKKSIGEREMMKILEDDIYPLLLMRDQPIYTDKALQKVANMMNVSIDSLRSDFLKKKKKIMKSVHKIGEVSKQHPVEMATNTPRLTFLAFCVWQKDKKSKIWDDVLSKYGTKYQDELGVMIEEDIKLNLKQLQKSAVSLSVFYEEKKDVQLMDIAVSLFNNVLLFEAEKKMEFLSREIRKLENNGDDPPDKLQEEFISLAKKIDILRNKR